MHLGLFDIHQVDPTADPDPAAAYRDRLDDLALADALGGFRVAFTAERHYLAAYRCQAAGVWLAAASQRTATLRLGVLAYTLPIRPPLALAEEIATLDQLTGGRLEVGVGLGHRPEELLANGVDPAQRTRIFQERLAVLEGLLAGHAVDVESDHTTIRGAFVSPGPVQRPHPPLWFAGTDPTAAAWAGQHGMNLAVGFAPADALFGATAGFRQGAELRRRRLAADARAAGTPDAATADAATADAGAPDASPHGAGSPDASPGAPDTLRRGQVALMRHAYVADTDALAEREMLDDLVRLKGGAAEGDRADRREAARADLARLLDQEIFVAGGPETVARAIARSRTALGVDLFLANVHAAGVDRGRVHRTLRLLSGPVRAALSTALPSPTPSVPTSAP